MRFRWVVIPLLVFVIAFSISAMRSVLLHRNISRVIETARENAWPLIVVPSMNYSFPFGLYTLEGAGTLLPGPQPLVDLDRYCDELFFGDDLKLYFPDSNLRTTAVMRLPDYKLRLIGDDLSGLGEKIPLSHTKATNYGRYQWSEDAYMRDGSYTGNFTQVDLDLLRIAEFELRSTPEWIELGRFGLNPSYVWNNGDQIYMQLKIEHGVPTTYWDPGDFQICRYDVSSGEWEAIYLIPEKCRRGTVHNGPNAEVIGIDYEVYHTSGDYGPSIVDFIDGNTGALINREENARVPFVGERWAACIGRSSKNVGQAIILFDMENDWERHEIIARDQPGSLKLKYTDALALYEFPSDSE